MIPVKKNSGMAAWNAREAFSIDHRKVRSVYCAQPPVSIQGRNRDPLVGGWKLDWWFLDSWKL
jgi:hypothetical protein